MSRKCRFLNEDSIRDLIDDDDDGLELDIDQQLVEEEEDEDEEEVEIIQDVETIREVEVYVGQEEVTKTDFLCELQMNIGTIHILLVLFFICF